MIRIEVLCDHCFYRDNKSCVYNVIKYSCNASIFTINCDNIVSKSLLERSLKKG